MLWQRRDTFALSCHFWQKRTNRERRSRCPNDSVDSMNYCFSCQPMQRTT